VLGLQKALPDIDCRPTFSCTLQRPLVRSLGHKLCLLKRRAWLDTNAPDQDGWNRRPAPTV